MLTILALIKINIYLLKVFNGSFNLACSILGHINMMMLGLVYEKYISRLMEVYPTTLNDHFSTSLESVKLGHESDER
jgi:hypothetical protein